MSKLSIPFTYLIGWTTQNKWYYGCRYSKNCDPADLWVTYFTSSVAVAKFRKIHGEPDVIQIRKTFVTKEETKLWEDRVLMRISAHDRSKWLNVRFGTFKGIGCSEHSETTKSKISRTLTGRIRPTSYAEKMSNKVWINDGRTNKRLTVGTELPIGWVEGRLQNWKSRWSPSYRITNRLTEETFIMTRNEFCKKYGYDTGNLPSIKSDSKYTNYHEWNLQLA